MSTDTQRCAACGEATDGKFCGSCGAPQTGGTCGTCGNPTSAHARFCHLCGAPQGRQVGPRSSVVPWVAAGTAVVVTLLVAGSRFVGSEPAASPVQRPVATSPGSASPAGAVPDITSMTLRERADRLFERIMMASESGDTSQVAFFSPMALQSYAMLGELDADARYHLALIHTASGSADAARVQGDSIRLLDRDHLFAILIDAAVAGLEGNDEAKRDAYRRFLATVEAELAKDRPEYRDHQSALDAYRREAREALGPSAGNE